MVWESCIRPSAPPQKKYIPTILMIVNEMKIGKPSIMRSTRLPSIITKGIYHSILFGSFFCGCTFDLADAGGELTKEFCKQ
jgi:hypothetical protein